MNIQEIQNKIKNCQRCHLCKSMPYSDIEEFQCTPTPGAGNPGADLMLIGEALGESEAIYGVPFCGLSGQFLDKMLERANIDRSDCYISNIVHCRPTENNKGNKNRPPTDIEIRWCKKWIWEEIQAIDPKIIILLGKIPTYTLLHSQINKTFSIIKIMGQEYTTNFHSAIFIPVPHPSFLLAHGKKYIENTIQILKDVKSKLDA